jgi:hypothetical protein
MYMNHYEVIGNPVFEFDGCMHVRATVPADKHGFLPGDLVSLPTSARNSYPDDAPLSAEDVRTLMWLFSGNITHAARYYHVPTARLRAFVRKSPYVQREVDEIRERLLDVAESVIHDALFSSDPRRSDVAARFVIGKSVQGRARMQSLVDKLVDIKISEKGVVFVWRDQK